MKAYKIVLFSLLFTITFTSCSIWSNNDLVDNAKNEILEENSSKIDKDDDTFESNFDKFEEAENSEKENKVYSSDYLTEEKYISLDDLDISNLNNLELEIRWNVLIDSVDTIVVNFSNIESPFPEDSYTLSTYEKWDESFIYRAFSKYEVLDYWKNIFLIEAYSWEKVSKLQLIVNISKNPEENKVTNKEDLSFSDDSEYIDLSTMPSSTVYGTPSELWNWDITYSDIKGLVIKKVWDLELSYDSAKISDFVMENFKSYPYWNTLRYIKDDMWLSFYLVREVDWKYKYEKHYYIDSSYYWILSLEEWEIDSSDENFNLNTYIRDLNNNLKETNDNFVLSQVSDILFRQLISN